MLQNYLYPEFIRDLTIKTPDEFVQTYGTHVLLDISIGGRIQFNYRSTIFETSNAVDKKRIVEAGVKFTIGIFGADFSNSYTQQEVITSNQKNATWNTEIEFFGEKTLVLLFHITQNPVSLEVHLTSLLGKTPVNVKMLQLSR